MFSQMDWLKEGKDPDYRFTLANERTYLAWIRTALAVLAGGLLMRLFAASVEPRWIIMGISAALVLLAGVLGGSAYVHWRGNEIAMRHSRPLPRPFLIPLLALAVLALCAAATALIVIQ